MLKDSQVDLCGRTDFTRTAPLLARDKAFSFACAGCGGCRTQSAPLSSVAFLLVLMMLMAALVVV